jgi:polysaccharide biosynthesis protein PslH
MRILYLLQDFPCPPTYGIRWKIYNLLSYMARRHECHVLSFGDADSTQKAEDWINSLPGLRVLGVFPQPKGWQLKAQQVRQFLKGNPRSLARWESSALTEAIRQVSNPSTYDIVHYDMINMAQYQPLLQDIPGILSTNDAMVMRYLRSARATNTLFIKMVLWLAARRLQVYETKVVRRFAALHVVSQIDANFIVAHNPSANNVEVINVCVDPNFLETPWCKADQDNIRDRKAILFTSGYLQLSDISEPLQQFVVSGFRQVRSIWPNLELYVLGGGHPPKRVIRNLMAEPGVHLLPWVDDYIGTLKNADLAIFFDKAGGGTKNRVIQAMAVGKPVVGTPVAMEGIGVTNGVDAFVCRSSEKMVEAVLRVLEDAEPRSRMGGAARELIIRDYAQEGVGRQWENLYQRVVRKSRLQ